MMKKTLCLIFVLAIIAQICAMPADHVDAEKDATGAADHVTGLKDEAAKRASDATDKETNDVTDGANKVTGATDEAENKGEHGVAKHGGKDCHKPGTHYGPITGAIKGTEEFGKKMADVSVKVVNDALRMFLL